MLWDMLLPQFTLHSVCSQFEIMEEVPHNREHFSFPSKELGVSRQRYGQNIQELQIKSGLYSFELKHVSCDTKTKDVEESS